MLSNFPFWLVLALLAVAGKTAYYLLQKQLIDGDDSSAKLGFISAFYGVLFITPIGAYKLITNTAEYDLTVIGIIVALGCVEVLGLVVYLEALGATDISIASPLKKSKPVLISVLEPFVLGIVFNPLLILGASLTGLGGFVVLADDLDYNSLKKKLTEKGPLLAIAAALIYTLLSLGSRFGNSSVGPFVFGGIVMATMLVGFTALLRYWNEPLPTTELAKKEYIAVGITGIGRSLFVWAAYALASATLVSSITQLTILLDVLIGGYLFSEENIVQKSIGATMILIGVLVVLLV